MTSSPENLSSVNQLPLGKRIKRKLHHLTAKWLIRFNLIKEATYTVAELNDMLATNFPQTLTVQLPSGNGELILLESELSIPAESQALHIQMLCGFNVSFVNQEIYRAHLIVTGTVVPYYDEQQKAIRIKDMAIDAIRLVQDDYAFISSTRDLVSLFMPGPFKYMLSTTVEMTLALLKGFISLDLFNYLMIYSSASKQKVLDFHKNDIERRVIREIEEDEWFYELDEQDIEERLFLEFGQQVVVENGQLVFKFYQD